MRVHHQPSTDLTYSDVFLVPSRSEVISRLDVDLASDDGTGTTIPLVAANMTAVTGQRMVETLARRGGLAVLPQDVPLECARATSPPGSSSATPGLETPVTLAPEDTVIDALHLMSKRAHGAVAVADATAAASAWSARPTARAWTASPRCSPSCGPTPDHRRALRCRRRRRGPGGRAARGLRTADAARRRFAPVVRDGLLVGALTRTGALRSTIYQPALDAAGRLKVAAAVGINGDVQAKAAALLEAGVDVPGRGHRARPPAQDVRRAAAPCAS